MDCAAADATARGVTQVLRLALIHALFDGAEKIGVDHLDAALALWAYCEHSAKWLFSTHELEVQSENAGGLAAFIREGGRNGRTRTEIYRDHFRSNIKAAEITVQLTQLVHDGVVAEVKSKAAGREISRYVHRDQRTDVLTHYAVQDTAQSTSGTHLRTDDPSVDASAYVKQTYSKNIA